MNVVMVIMSVGMVVFVLGMIWIGCVIVSPRRRVGLIHGGSLCEIPSTIICEGGYAIGHKGKKRDWFCTNDGVWKEEMV